MKSETEILDVEAEVAHLNDVALEKAKAEFGILLRYEKGVRWRATLRATGDIPGIPFALTILCTDGCVAWFVTSTGMTFFGHIQHFSGDVLPMYSAKKAGESKEAAKKRVKRESSEAKRRSTGKPASRGKVSLAVQWLTETLGI